MQFDWTTFALEILNFLVLLWVLKRFLYRPVLDVIDARRAAVREQDEAVRARQRDADEMKSRYENLIAAWNQEREQARQALDAELGKQKAAGIEAVRHDIDAEREKTSARAAAANAAHEAEVVRQAIDVAYRHASAMLQRLASPDLTSRIIDVFQEDLQNLDEAEKAKLSDAAAMQPDAAAAVATAHPVDADAQQRLSRILAAAVGTTLAPDFIVQPELVAGVRIGLGHYLLKADLADELHFFMERDLRG